MTTDKTSLLRYFYIGLGSLSLGLGVLGAFLPVLPTTPFLLLTAFCYARGSQRFNAWFLSTGLYRKHVRAFMQSRAMTRKTKAAILAYASLTLGLSFYFSENIYVRILIIGLGLIMYYYFFFRIKTQGP